jgi:hypothetical protein
MVNRKHPGITVRSCDDPKEYQRQRRQLDKDYIKEYNSSEPRQRKGVERIRLKKWQLLQYKGCKCIKCGLAATEENSCIFDFHHIEPKVFNMAPFTRSYYSLQEESRKCVVLCANCHRMEHKKYY